MFWGSNWKLKRPENYVILSSFVTEIHLSSISLLSLCQPFFGHFFVLFFGHFLYSFLDTFCTLFGTLFVHFLGHFVFLHFFMLFLKHFFGLFLGHFLWQKYDLAQYLFFTHWPPPLWSLATLSHSPAPEGTSYPRFGNQEV